MGGHRTQHRIAETAVVVVVLNYDESVVSLRSSTQNALGVDRLDRVGIDHTDGDAGGAERLVGGKRFVERHPGGNNGHTVAVAGPQDFAAADRKLLGVRVNHRRGRTRGTAVGRALELSWGSEQALGRYRIK